MIRDFILIIPVLSFGLHQHRIFWGLDMKTYSEFRVRFAFRRILESEIGLKTSREVP